MILVDSSVWIDFFSFSPTRAGAELYRMIEDSEPVAVAGVIVSEVLQGLTRNIDEIAHQLSLWEFLEPSGFATYREAAVLFRMARSKGIALTTIDALIAAIALEHKASVFTRDKDFSRLAQITKLPLFRATL